MTRVSVVIPVRDDADHLRRCLAALAAQTRGADEVVVVDNGSSDESAAVARDAGAVVVTEPVRGIAGASARGYDAATGDVLVRLDADSVPPPDWIAAALRLLADPAVVAVTGPVGRSTADRSSAGCGTRSTCARTSSSCGPALGRPPLFGSALAMRRSTWQAVRARVHRDDPEVHDDVDLSMALDPAWRVLADRSLTVQVSARPLSGLRSVVVRTRGRSTPSA